MELKRVVVTGIGALTPVGNTAAETWENLVKGVSGAGPITHFDASKFKTQFACEVKNFKVTDFIDRKEARKMDLYEQYALVAAMEAVNDCGWDLETVDKDRIGVVLGVGIGGLHSFEEEAGNYAVNGAEMGPKYNPFFIPKMIADIASGQISIMYGFHGPNYTTTSACASSTNAIGAAFDLIRMGKADAIITVSKSGETARLMCKYRSETPIIACVLQESVQRHLSLSWGITPLLMPYARNTDELVEFAVQAAEKAGLLAKGDLAVVTAGVPVGVSGTTNMIKIHMVGDALLTGVGVGNHSAKGPLCVCHSPEEVRSKFHPGDVLVLPYTTNSIMEFIRLAAAVITEEGGVSSHAASVCLALDKPAIVGAMGACRNLKDGMFVSVDCERGIVQAMPQL